MQDCRHLGWSCNQHQVQECDSATPSQAAINKDSREEPEKTPLSMKLRNIKAKEGGERIGKTREHPRALPCGSNHPPQQTWQLYPTDFRSHHGRYFWTSLFVSSLAFIFSLTVIYLPLYYTSFQTIKISHQSKTAQYNTQFHDNDLESLINDYTAHFLLSRKEAHKTF